MDMLQAMQVFNQAGQLVAQAKNLMAAAAARAQNQPMTPDWLASISPEIKEALEYSRQSGKSFQDVFYEKAREKGIDVNNIGKELMSHSNKL